MSTIVQGNAAEASVLQQLTLAGIHVLVPFGDGLAFDLVGALPDGRLLKIQVKSGRVRNGCVEFNSHSTDHGRGQQDYRGRADVIAVYVAALAEVFVIPVDDCPASKGYLRLTPPRNNQRRRVRLARDYSFDSWARQVGAGVATAAA